MNYASAYFCAGAGVTGGATIPSFFITNFITSSPSGLYSSGVPGLESKM
jgi:hypothetical protein